MSCFTGVLIQNGVFFIPSQNVSLTLDFPDADMVNLSLFQLKLLILVSLFPSEKPRQVHTSMLHYFSVYLMDYWSLRYKLWQIEREGKDVTITAFSKMVGYALKVCHCFP